MTEKKAIWLELRAQLEKFQAMQEDKATPIVAMTTQRLRIEALLKALDDASEKAA